MQRQGQTQGVHGQHLSTYADCLRGQKAGGLKGDRLQVTTNKEENGVTVRAPLEWKRSCLGVMSSPSPGGYKATWQESSTAQKPH